MVEGLLLSAANIGAGLLGYVFQSAMGKLLLPAEYGQLTSIVALGIFLASPLNALTMLISREVGWSTAANTGIAEFKNEYLQLLKKAVIFIAIAACIFIIFITNIQDYLRLKNFNPLILFFIYLSFLIICSINFAYFQGVKNFKLIASFEILGVGLKIVLSVIFVALGYGVSGAIGGMALAAVIIGATGSIVLVRVEPVLIKNLISQSTEVTKLKSRPLMVVLAAVGFSAITQLDVVYANMYFSAKDVGLYAAVSILGKAIFYLPGGFAMALFPAVVANDAAGISSYSSLFKALVASIVLCVCGAFFYLFFGAWIIKFFYGPSYSEASLLLGIYGFAVIPFGIIMLGEQFLIAKGRTLFTWIFLLFAPLQYYAISIWHDSLQTLIMIIGLSGLSICLIGYGILALEVLKDKIFVSR